jgi:transposase
MTHRERFKRHDRRHDVQVSAKIPRRRFTAEYKLKIVREADGCSKPGELGALLRKEGLYSSHLLTGRRARERGELIPQSDRSRKTRHKTPRPDGRARRPDRRRDYRREHPRQGMAGATLDAVVLRALRRATAPDESLPRQRLRLRGHRARGSRSSRGPAHPAPRRTAAGGTHPRKATPLGRRKDQQLAQPLPRSARPLRAQGR